MSSTAHATSFGRISSDESSGSAIGDRALLDRVGIGDGDGDRVLITDPDARSPRSPMADPRSPGRFDPDPRSRRRRRAIHSSTPPPDRSAPPGEPGGRQPAATRRRAAARRRRTWYVLRRDAEQHAGDGAAQGPCGQQAGRDAAEGHPEPFLQQQADDVVPLRAERDADADLACPLGTA